ncbi:DUF2254 family protein [Streptomyces sp. NBC_01481]|uniref:DUF2254 family protein n=1 Tax=Streptomyces sp. NBC_01481 TaxID=2975869 RepID=UPI002255971D|nr:DUF2254 family protein [Streptomyces sp. NBC_01481]MCX4585646.1 DUF2254 domain-containing protein [Streptomyces sp. NBC_01481]
MAERADHGGEPRGARTRPRGRSRPAGLFHRPRRAMRAELSQLLCAVVGFGLGLAVPEVTAGPEVDAGRVVNLLFTVGFGVISLVSIIYSVLFLVVQFNATTFSPRLGLFRDDPIVWRTFAFAIGVFVFSMTAGLAIGTEERVSAFLPWVAVLLALVALLLMRNLQTRAFQSLQLAPTLAAITSRAHRVFDVLYTKPYGDAAPAAGAPPGPGKAVTVRWTGRAAVLQQIDVPALVAVAKQYGCVITLRQSVGAMMARGMALAEVRGGELPEEALRGTLLTGEEHSFAQDAEFPFRLLADIALKALSPAVNDPATAVQALDHVEDLLIRLADRDLDIGRVADAEGTVRLIVPVPAWERYVTTSVDDITVAAADSPMVLLRIRTMLRRLLEACPAERRPLVSDRLRWVEDAGAEDYPLHWEPHAEKTP